MDRRTFLKLGGGCAINGLAAGAEPGVEAHGPGSGAIVSANHPASRPASKPLSIMVATADEHRSRLRNVAECNRAIRSCLRRHLITDYLPGQVAYNLGEYPCRKPWNPDDWDEQQLDQMKAAGIELVQVMEEWNDLLRRFGGNKFTPVNEPAFRRFVRMVQSRGMKLIVYVSACFLDRTDPDLRPEWARLPDLELVHWHLAHCSPASPGWRAYLLPRILRILDNYDLDGLYCDLGYLGLYNPGVKAAADEVPAFEETAAHEGPLEDLLGILYGEVRRRGGIFKVHRDGNLAPAVRSKVYDYLWVGEGVSNADQMREAVKNHEPYVVPCLDLSRATLKNENDLYLHAIPYMQFPLLLAGRPFTGERASIPGIKYPPEEKDIWVAHCRNIWRRYQAHPEGPHSYGIWDSCPGRAEARSTCYRWLQLYRPMVRPGTWAYIELGDCDLFARPLPKGVVASAFANSDLYLVLANYAQTPASIETAARYTAMGQSPVSPANLWQLEGRSLLILKRAVPKT
jgi:hypothetical protein